MYKMKKLNLERKKFNSKGITLVALVVTIVILLILAGITVASLTGDNGLIGKSGEAKKQTEISEGLEQIEIAVTQSTNKRGNIDETKLAKNLSKINGLKYISSDNEEIDVTENTEIKLTAKVKLKGNTFKINDEGNISYKKDGTIDNEDIINSPETYYGHYVTNYNSPNDAGIQDANGQLGKWQIFMADDTNIYLIASNYITRQYTGTKNSVGFDYNTANQTPATATKMWFTSILGQYNANSTITDIPTILSKLDKQNIYHKWMNTEANQTRNYNNEKAVASMLDVDVWNGYKNTTYAKYAIGGPTIEMFCESYNKTRTDGTALLEAKETNNDNTNGYRIQKGTAEPANSVAGLVTRAKNTSVNNMYFKSSSEGNHYWLASPSANGSTEQDVLRVDYDGNVTRGGRGYGYNGIGFRPLVCLKSNVHLVENSDGQTYSLELD